MNLYAIRFTLLFGVILSAATPLTAKDISKRPTVQGLAPTHADVAYGDDSKQVFDIWLAKSENGKPTPLCLFIHGGGFHGGDKIVAASAVQPFLDAGISFASLSYRLTDGGKNPYPIPMMDCARALQFIRSKAAEWNLDPKRVASQGGSAGAGISLWLAFHDDLAKPDATDPVARQSTRLIAVGTINAQSTYDMRTVREWFGLPNLAPHPALTELYAVKNDADWNSERVLQLMHDASPISHLTADDPPVFLVYKAGDTPVTASSDPGAWIHHIRLGQKLQEAMIKLGLECTVAQGDDGKMGDFLIRQLNKGQK
jgi:acetyl esterase/lipase